MSYDVIALLANHPVFRHLAEHEQLDLANNSNIKGFYSGELVFAKSDPAGASYIVIKGRVLIGNYSVDGKRTIYDIMCHGDIFGEVSAIDGNVHTDDATALEDTKLLIIRRSVLRNCIIGNSMFSLSLLENTCKHVRFGKALLDDLFWLDVPSRLAKRLLALAEKQEAFEQRSGVRVCRYSQNSLASMIGASRQTVNKMLRDWQHQSIVELHREEIIVCNATLLRDIAGSLS